jgi:SAM-dependent methyltransferase
MPMAEHHRTEIYTQSFEMYLSHTDEKKVLLKAILKEILTLKPESVLDIGAGNGDLAIPLSKEVEVYKAIEQKSDFAKKLRVAGIEVYEEVFPFATGRQYDFVLVSHALPWKSSNFKLFIEGMVPEIKKGGFALIITYDDEVGEWNDLMDFCGLSEGRVISGRVKEVKNFLASYGKLTDYVVTSYLKTDTIENMIEALAFVFSDGRAERIELFKNHERVRVYIEEHFRTKEGYNFPFHHLFLKLSL